MEQCSSEVEEWLGREDDDAVHGKRLVELEKDGGCDLVKLCLMTGSVVA